MIGTRAGRARDVAVAGAGGTGGDGSALGVPGGHKVRSRATVATLAVVAAALPALFYLALSRHTGRMQWHDYYVVLAGMIEGDHLSGSVARWLTIKSNEHTVTVPALVYAADLFLFRGDNRPLAALAVLCQLAVVILLFLRAPPDLRARSAAILAAALLGGLAFTPAASHQFILGFSGVMWVIADLLAVLAIVALVHSDESPRPALWVCLSIAAGAVGVVTFSTALAVWPALLLGALLLRSGRRMLPGLVLGALLAGHLAGALYWRPPHHPGLELSDFGALASFVAVFVGWIFSHAREVAAGLGWVGIAGAVAAWIMAIGSRDGALRRELAPWLMLQLYGLANGAMAAVTRSGFGESASAQPRYGLLAALFWIGTFGAAVVLGRRRLPRRCLGIAGWGLAALALLAVGATWRRGAVVLRVLLTDACWQPVAEISVRYGIPDGWSGRRFLIEPAPDWLFSPASPIRSFMKAQRHVPFDRVPHPGPGDRLPPEELVRTPPADLVGGIERVTALGRDAVRVEAWIDTGGSPIDGALVVAADGLVCGELATVNPMTGVRPVAHPGAVILAGYARPRSPSEPLQAVVRRRSDRFFHPLGAAWTR